MYSDTIFEKDLCKFTMKRGALLSISASIRKIVKYKKLKQHAVERLNIKLNTFTKLNNLFAPYTSTFLLNR